MNAKNLGNTIAALRRQNNMTQSALAEKLKVSGKTISKWENGLGFPEITQIPSIANIFGVSIDYLMTGEKHGIAIAGTILVDIVKTIDCYPKAGMLSEIHSVSRCVGGCTPNTAIDLAKIDHNVPISAVGKVGDDEYGSYVISQMQKNGIDVSRVSVSADLPTSFSDVMSMPSGERTFFHARGANADFSPSDIDISQLDCSILHIGYILLLDKFDAKDEKYGTVMARFLHDVQEKGIKTSIDVVSSSGADYNSMIAPALKYCNYCIINEIECCEIWGLDAYNSDGKLNLENIKDAMRKCAECGVKEKVIVHSKKLGLCLDVASDSITIVPSLKIPSAEIKGSVGAGDAFCAASLYCLYSGYSDQELLEFASAAAAANLFAENSIDGMLPKNDILNLEKKYGRQEI